MRLRLPIPALLLALASASAVSAQSPAQNRPPAQPASSNESSSSLLTQVNSCDVACQDQVARAVRQGAVNVSTKQPAPNVAEKSKKDQAWQALLVEAIAVQAQSCEGRAKKNQDASANKEIALRTSGIASRANAHIKKVSDPYLAQFMRMQLNRVWNANCPSSVEHIPSRHDPEDAEAQKDESATNDPPDDNR
jgi:post-segregation antitoxin (ccd killing protein)